MVRLEWEPGRQSSRVIATPHGDCRSYFRWKHEQPAGLRAKFFTRRLILSRAVATSHADSRYRCGPCEATSQILRDGPRARSLHTLALIFLIYRLQSGYFDVASPLWAATTVARPATNPATSTLGRELSLREKEKGRKGAMAEPWTEVFYQAVAVLALMIVGLTLLNAANSASLGTPLVPVAPLIAAGALWLLGWIVHSAT